MNKTLGQFSNELRLMLACAYHDADHPLSDEMTGLLASPIDWDLFLKLSHHHRVDPLVYRTLCYLQDGIIPETVLSALQTQCRKNAVQAVQMAAVTARLVTCFATNGIRTVVLKGPPLAQGLYGNVALRPSHDIDLLVWPEDLTTACTVLEKEGYRRIHPDFPLTRRRLQLYLKVAHHFSYLHQKTGVLVELHWRLGHCGIELPLPQTDQITIYKLGGRDVPVLTAEDGLLFLVLHGVSHSWFRLRWLLDIGKLLDHELDWDRIVMRARKMGIPAYVDQALILADQLLGAPIPARFHEALAKDRRARRLAEMAVSFIIKFKYDPFDLNRPSDVGLYLLWKKYNYQVRVGLRNKLKYIGNHFKPSEVDIQWIALPDILFPLYYIIRPFFWVKRRLFNH
ncbi:MAG TPA: nucleotidyltransferase family protein [Bacillota bacterium]|nr:nucleotidyltransferase family protein [Bacillota bacterium]